MSLQQTDSDHSREPQGTSGLGVLRGPASKLSIFVISGALTMPGTSSAEDSTMWESYDRHYEATLSSPAYAVDQALEPSVLLDAQPTSEAVARLRRISGLTWEQLARMFDVSRRSMHFWASGKPLSASNEEMLHQVLAIVSEADRGSASETRAALLDPSGGQSAFDLLTTGLYDEARRVLGVGVGRRDVERSELSAETSAARRPLPPEELVGAEQDRVHRDVGRGRVGRTVRNKRRGRSG